MKSVSIRILVTLVIVASLTSCTEEGDVITVDESNEVFTGMTLESVENYLLVPGVDNPIRAIAHFGANAVQDWTDRVTWSVSDPNWGEISSAGVLRPMQAGTGQVRAISPELWVGTQDLLVRDIVSIEAFAEQSSLILRNEFSPVSARVTLSDNSVVVLGSELPVVWSVSDPAIARVDEYWNVHGISMGSSAVRARLVDVISSPVIFTIDSVLSLEVAETTMGPYLPFDTVGISAIAVTWLSGTLDVRDRVAWGVSDSLHLIPLQLGEFIPVAAGEFMVQALLVDQVSPPLPIYVWNVTTIVMEPSIVLDTLQQADTLHFSAVTSAEGHGEVDLTERVDWLSSNPAVGFFLEPGVFLPASQGMTSVSAKLGVVTSNAVDVVCNVPSVFEENFESYPLGTLYWYDVWDVFQNGSPGQRVAVAYDQSRGSRVLMIVDSSNTYSTIVDTAPQVFSAHRGQVTFGARVNGHGLRFIVGAGASQNQRAMMIEFSGGSIHATNSNTLTPIHSYVVDRWYEFVFTFDCSTDRYDVYVDGERFADNFLFEYPQAVLHYVRMQTLDALMTNRSYVDDIIVSEQ